MHDQPAGPMHGRRQPSRGDVIGNDRLIVIRHPVSDSLMATIRDCRSDAGSFGSAAQQLAMYLLWEGARELQSELSTVVGFDGSEVDVRRVTPEPAGVSILRAGEVFAGVFRQMFPRAPLFHLGIRRNEATLDHDVYRDTIHPRFKAQRVFILDPMLATGGSVVVTVERIRKHFAGPIDVVSLVAAPLGVETVLAADDHLRVIAAALDDYLNDQGYIIPGLGDAGDRFFGT